MWRYPEVKAYTSFVGIKVHKKWKKKSATNLKNKKCDVDKAEKMKMQIFRIQNWEKKIHMSMFLLRNTDSVCFL